MIARIRQLAALVVTLAFLVGIPYLLTAVLTWPELDLSWLIIEVYLRSGRLPPGVLTTALMAALWGAWGIYLLAVLTEILAYLRGSRVRLRPLGPLQFVAATALGATLSTPAAAHATPAPAPLVTESVEPSEQTPRFQEESPTPPLTPATETEPGSEFYERTRTINGFGYDSATLSEEMRSSLAPTITLIAEYGAPNRPVVITGHTDTAGDANYNQELSQRRAEAVADYLRDQLGENAPTIETHGRGEEEPLPGADDASQRRVEIAYTVTPSPAQEENTPATPQPTPSPSSNPDAEQPAVVLLLPSGAVLSLTTGAAAAAGAAGGYALAHRRRPTVERGRRATPAAETTDPLQDPTGRAAPPNRDKPSTATEPRPEQAQDLDARIVVELAHLPGVGIQGPGAEDAARALLAAALRGAPTSAPVRVLLTENAATRLLGEETTALLSQRRTPNIELAESLPAAMRELHTEMIERQHHIDDAEVDSLTALRSTHGNETVHPPVVLITGPSPEQEAALAALLRSGRDVGITAIVLGRWSLGTLTIAAKGTITDASPPLEHVRGAQWPTTSRTELAPLIENLPPTSPFIPPEPDIPPPATASTKEATAPQPAAPPAVSAEEKQTRPVRLHLLGPLRITVNGERVELRRNSGYEIAAYLALHPEGIQRDQAIEDMWPQEDPRRATHRWHDAISNLRRLLHSTRGENAPAVVARTGSTYRLVPEVTEVDLWELTAELDAAEHASTDKRQKHLQRALRLYTGDLATEADYPWIEPFRLQVRRRLILALRHHADQVGTDQPDSAAALLQRAIELDPTEEDSHAALIRLHLKHGDTDAARRSYERCVDSLRRISTEPSTYIRKLADPENAI